MIPCEVIRDLFLLYESKECSKETIQFVEEHTKECETCRIELENLMKPVELVTYQDEFVQKEISVKKGFKKIRRRWIISVICIVLILPITGVSILTKNEINKESICFSNIDDLYHSRSFLKAIQNKAYVKAFTYLDVKSVYDRLIYGYVFNTKLDELYEVIIDGETWYIDNSLYLNEYQTYINTGDDMMIWDSLINANSSHDGMTAIPKEKMSKELLEQLTASNEGIIIFDEESYSNNDEKTYYLWKDDMGREYYFPEQRQKQTEEGTEISDSILFMQSRCIPIRAYDDLIKGKREEEAVIKAYVDYYRDMGFETYKEKSKKYFLENMKRFEEEGYTISSFDLNPYYYYNEPNREWTITATLKLYQDGILCEEQSQYGNVKQNVRNSLSIDSTNNGIALHSSYLGLRLEDPMERAINYLGLTEDVDNYFGY